MNSRFFAISQIVEHILQSGKAHAATTLLQRDIAQYIDRQKAGAEHARRIGTDSAPLYVYIPWDESGVQHCRGLLLRLIEQSLQINQTYRLQHAVNHQWYDSRMIGGRAIDYAHYVGVFITPGIRNRCLALLKDFCQYIQTVNISAVTENTWLRSIQPKLQQCYTDLMACASEEIRIWFARLSPSAQTLEGLTVVRSCVAVACVEEWLIVITRFFRDAENTLPETWKDRATRLFRGRRSLSPEEQAAARDVLVTQGNVVSALVQCVNVCISGVQDSIVPNINIMRTLLELETLLPEDEARWGHFFSVLQQSLNITVGRTYAIALHEAAEVHAELPWDSVFTTHATEFARGLQAISMSERYGHHVLVGERVWWTAEQIAEDKKFLNHVIRQVVRMPQYEADFNEHIFVAVPDGRFVSLTFREQYLASIYKLKTDILQLHEPLSDEVWLPVQQAFCHEIVYGFFKEVGDTFFALPRSEQNWETFCLLQVCMRQVVCSELSLNFQSSVTTGLAERFSSTTQFQQAFDRIAERIQQVPAVLHALLSDITTQWNQAHKMASDTLIQRMQSTKAEADTLLHSAKDIAYIGMAEALYAPISEIVGREPTHQWYVVTYSRMRKLQQQLRAQLPLLPYQQIIRKLRAQVNTAVLTYPGTLVNTAGYLVRLSDSLLSQLTDALLSQWSRPVRIALVDSVQHPLSQFKFNMESSEQAYYNQQLTRLEETVTDYVQQQRVRDPVTERRMLIEFIHSACHLNTFHERYHHGQPALWFAQTIVGGRIANDLPEGYGITPEVWAHCQALLQVFADQFQQQVSSLNGAGYSGDVMLPQVCDLTQIAALEQLQGFLQPLIRALYEELGEWCFSVPIQWRTTQLWQILATCMTVIFQRWHTVLMHYLEPLHALGMPFAVCAPLAVAIISILTDIVGTVLPGLPWDRERLSDKVNQKLLQPLLQVTLSPVDLTVSAPVQALCEALYEEAALGFATGCYAPLLRVVEADPYAALYVDGMPIRRWVGEACQESKGAPFASVMQSVPFLKTLHRLKTLLNAPSAPEGSIERTLITEICMMQADILTEPRSSQSRSMFEMSLRTSDAVVPPPTTSSQSRR
ncbi:MAG: hypothetical protein A3J38_04000 [Gammaproteobacteria bacterium RIFCSPHIGHO2_12_FULL_45_9]|nr:MAG: hypothetical protein A3J38_04000 [Gammaproteobacteria bacterium RIFCSPHIGHO2_12_FULL_45_9]